MGGDASLTGAELFEIEADFSAKIVTFRLVGGMHPPHPPPKSATAPAPPPGYATAPPPFQISDYATDPYGEQRMLLQNTWCRSTHINHVDVPINNDFQIITNQKLSAKC